MGGSSIDGREGPPTPEGVEDEPVMDRRLGADRRSGRDRRQEGGAEPRPPRRINQYDMDPEVLEFVNAVNRFRERSGNRFPSAADILRILESLGYRKGA